MSGTVVSILPSTQLMKRVVGTMPNSVIFTNLERPCKPGSSNAFVNRALQASSSALISGSIVRRNLFKVSALPLAGKL
jgi:hypothetical protein